MAFVSNWLKRDQAKSLKGATDRESKEALQGRESQGGPVKYRIGMAELSVLLLFATVFDLLSIIPIVNNVTGFVGTALLALFFYFHGVSYFGGKQAAKKILTIVGGLILEEIEVVSILPAFIAEVLIITWLSRTEDRTGVNVTAAIGGKPKVAKGGSAVLAKGTASMAKAPPSVGAVGQESVATPSGAAVTRGRDGLMRTDGGDEQETVASHGKEKESIEFGTGELLEEDTGGRKAPRKDLATGEMLEAAEEYSRKAASFHLRGRDAEARAYEEMAGELRAEYRKAKEMEGRKAT